MREGNSRNVSCAQYAGRMYPMLYGWSFYGIGIEALANFKENGFLVEIHSLAASRSIGEQGDRIPNY